MRAIRSPAQNRTVIAMSVDVQVATRAASVPKTGDIQRWVRAALQEIGAPGEPTDLCIRVVDSDEARVLNERYRGIDKPTNVLSFPAQVDVPGANILGDVVICAPVVSAEAADQGKNVGDHFAHMVVHGVLHLAGYDHEEPQDAELMEALEIRILERVGVTDPYTVS